MRTEHIRTASVIVFSAMVVVAGIVMVRQSNRLRQYDQQHARDVATIAQLRGVISHQPPQTAATAPQPGPPIAHGCAPTPEGTGLPASDAASQHLNADLNDARASLARLQAQLDSSKREKEEASAAVDALKQGEQDWRNRVDALQQQLDSARAEAEGARAARERAAALEAENARFRTESGAASDRAATVRKAMASLQDLERRRDVYLNSVLRRYRDITEQFRAMKEVIDSSRTSNPSSLNDVALSRIQNATSLAEDDLRRLNDLNAQGRQIENRLAKN